AKGNSAADPRRSAAWPTSRFGPTPKVRRRRLQHIRGPLTAGLALGIAATLLFALAPGIAGSHDTISRIDRCSQGIELDPGLREAVGRSSVHASLPETIRDGLAGAVVNRVDETDTRYAYRSMLACLESETVMPERAAATQARWHSTTRTLLRMGIPTQTVRTLDAPFTQIRTAFAHDDYLTAHETERQLVHQLLHMIIQHDGSAIAGSASAPPTDVHWLASRDFTGACSSATEPMDDSEGPSLCHEAAIRLQRAHSPCELLSAPAALASKACNADPAASTPEQSARSGSTLARS
ncbi:hypothetical protein, partial [Novosphingobium nitrogenifigens]|uniref:hypothetical protein n=1 Tax=Novosphingobium nitrogenifigens TaxID=378548 RepID=UPI001E5E4DF0